MSRILIVEDEPLIADFIVRGLHARGHSTELTDDPVRAEALALTGGGVDVIVLDLGLPSGDGFSVLQAVRERGAHMPVIVLTGRPDVRDAVACLEAGADDYMTKPFRFEELVARIDALLRRSVPTRDDVLAAGALRLDLRTRRATTPDRTVDLTLREFALLETFLRHPDQVLTREQLLSQVWGYYFEPGTNVLNVYVASLRRKIGSDSIETVRGVGYRLRSATVT
jgi:two-component system, OmpR family, copper resistance phosphate regulon response regulator CusR